MEKFELQRAVLIPEKLNIPKDVEIVRPVGVDLFFSGLGQETNLPLEIAANPTLLKQASQRRDLYSQFGRIFDHVKDENMDINEAMNKSLVSEEDITQLYNNLANFLETDDNNARIILYLPSQILPNLKNGEKEPEKLEEAKKRFTDLYKKAWIRLLFESESRASFVEGDVLEPGMGKPPRIRKAAHLIPDLLEKGILTTDDVIEQLDLSSEEELGRSLLEGIIVAKDRELITDVDWLTIKNLSKTKSIAVDVSSVSSKRDNKLEEKSLEEIINHLDNDLSGIDIKYAENSPYTASISVKRAKWEKSVRQDSAVDDVANELAKRLQREEIGIGEVENLSNKSGHTEEYSKGGIRSIKKAAEAYAIDDLEKSRNFARQYQGLIRKFWDSGSIEIKNEIISALSHFRRLNIIQDEDLQKFGISLPDLSSPFPVNIEDFVNTDLQKIIEITRKIRENPILSESIYPFMLAFGSRLKGYAGLNADMDAAIFIKPHVPWEKREAVLKQFREEVRGVKDLDKILEFWVEEKEKKLGFRVTPEAVETVVSSPQVHFLLGGVWVSQGEDYKKLYGDIVGKYLDLSRFEYQKDQARFQLLGQIELDILQYRLMHKGYKRFYPDKRGTGTNHSNLIDWESDFWDPGYRRIATKLFLSRVFLPDLS